MVHKYLLKHRNNKSEKLLASEKETETLGQEGITGKTANSNDNGRGRAKKRRAKRIQIAFNWNEEDYLDYIRVWFCYDYIKCFSHIFPSYFGAYDGPPPPKENERRRCCPTFVCIERNTSCRFSYSFCFISCCCFSLVSRSVLFSLQYTPFSCPFIVSLRQSLFKRSVCESTKNKQSIYSRHNFRDFIFRIVNAIKVKSIFTRQ